MFNQAFSDLKKSYELALERRQLFYDKYGIREFSTTVFYEHMQKSKAFIDEWHRVYEEHLLVKERLQGEFSKLAEEEIEKEISIAGFTLFCLKDDNLDIILFVDALDLLPWKSVKEFIKRWTPDQIKKFSTMLKHINPAPGADIGTNFFEMYKKFLPLIAAEACENAGIKPF